MTKQETDNYIKIGAVILAAIIVIYILRKFQGGFDSVLESLGLKDTAEEKETKAKLKSAEEKQAEAQRAAAEWQPSDFKYTQPETSLANLQKWVNIHSTKNKPLRMVKFNSGYFAKNAKNIYDSVGYLTDNPEKGLAEIKGMRTKAAIAYLTKDFKTVTGNDLFSWLSDRYDREAQKKVLSDIYAYADGLPIGIIDANKNIIIK